MNFNFWQKNELIFLNKNGWLISNWDSYVNDITNREYNATKAGKEIRRMIFSKIS